MSKNDREPYEVGFGKPPKKSRFSKGVSGNPKGRPKGRRNMATVLEQTLQEKIVVNENGVRTKVTKLEAAAKQLVNKAAAGDLNALRQLYALARPGEDQSIVPEKPLEEADLKVMENIRQRIEASLKGENNES